MSQRELFWQMVILPLFSYLMLMFYGLTSLQCHSVLINLSGFIVSYRIFLDVYKFSLNKVKFDKKFQIRILKIDKQDNLLSYQKFIY
jgi:hypothetical protein